VGEGTRERDWMVEHIRSGEVGEGGGKVGKELQTIVLSKEEVL
jgi:hypothetical protein